MEPTESRSAVPVALIVNHVLAFCDRKSYDNIMVANKEIYQMVQELHVKTKRMMLTSPASESSTFLPPWPVDQVLSVNNDSTTNDGLTKECRRSVSCLCVSNDGMYLAAGCDDGLAFVWNRMNGRETTLMPTTDENMTNRGSGKGQAVPGEAVVLSITFSQNSSKIATGSSDGSIRLYQLSEASDDDVGKNHRSITYADTICHQHCHRHPYQQQARPRPIYSLVFAAYHERQEFNASSPSCCMVSACHDVDVRLWDVAPWPSKSKCYGLIRHPDKVESVAVSPGDPFTVATSTWDGTIRLFGLAFDDCVDDRNATGTARPMVVSSRILGKGLPLTLVQFTQDGMHLQGVKGFRLRQWSVMQPKSQNDLSDNYGDGSEKDGKCETLSGRRANRIHHVTVSRQSHRIAYTESDGTLHISTLADAHYNAVVTKTMSTSRGDGSFCSNVNKITSSTFSNCGHFLFVACEDGTVQISMVP